MPCITQHFCCAGGKDKFSELSRATRLYLPHLLPILCVLACFAGITTIFFLS